MLERLQKQTNEKTVKLPFAIELHWIDQNGTILKDGEIFLNELLSYLSEEFEGGHPLGEKRSAPGGSIRAVSITMHRSCCSETC